MSVFRLVMHPASEGDALTLVWGEERDLYYALVDLGRTNDYKALRPTLEQIGCFELFTISHIDADHIEGAMPLLKERTAPFTPKDVWFNAWHHLKNAKTRLTNGEGIETLSIKHGEKLSAGILRFGWPWNCAFGKYGIVSIDSPVAQRPIELSGNLGVVLLSPGDEQLAALEPVWMRELARANLRPLDPDEGPRAVPTGIETLSSLNVELLARMPFIEDKSEPNGSSIAFFAEFHGRRVLLGADAHPNVLERCLKRFGYTETNRLKLDLLKLCHHGSKANTSPTFLKVVDCVHFAISTDGTKHNHPDRETIARIITNDPDRPKTFYFNVKHENATIWDRTDLKEKYKYTCVFPAATALGLTIDI